MILEWLKHQRRRRLRGRPFPKEWLTLVQRHAVFFHKLSGSDRFELLGHVQVFLAEKRFEGCGGFEITDEVRVTVAAQACLLCCTVKRIISQVCLPFLSIHCHTWCRKTIRLVSMFGKKAPSIALVRPRAEWVRWSSHGARSNMARPILPTERTLCFMNLPTSSITKTTQPTECR